MDVLYASVKARPVLRSFDVELFLVHEAETYLSPAVPLFLHVCDGFKESSEKQKASSVDPVQQVWGLNSTRPLQRAAGTTSSSLSPRIRGNVAHRCESAPPSLSLINFSLPCRRRKQTAAKLSRDKTGDDTVLPGNFNCFDNSSQASGRVQQCSWQKRTSAPWHRQEGGEVNSVLNVMKIKGFFFTWTIAVVPPVGKWVPINLKTLQKGLFNAHTHSNSTILKQKLNDFQSR